MTDVAEPHVNLSEYLLGGLSDDESMLVERHLSQCPECLAEAEQLSEAAAALVLLTPADHREIVAQFAGGRAQGGAAAAKPAPATSVQGSGRQGPERVEALVAGRPRGRDRSSRGPGRRTRAGLAGLLGAAGASERAADGARRRRNRTLFSLGGLALVVVLSIGIVVGLTLTGSGGGSGAGTITLSAAAEDRVSGATLSVFVSGHGDSVTVRATVTGLVRGSRYQLYAVRADGRTAVVSSWIGSSGAQEVNGTLAVPLDQLTFFAVTPAGGGTPAVSAYLTHPSPSTR